ncbi:hypothetical protein POSPLADRAFT_1047377 [Postia placenta MAD-698-R-SB12]|uniref:Secreted protein n=1 Tax=Postia placenta MAD-698-R-SB12 TaxID=670580 RepID=A0A1X6MXN3_9APHY|nr:hypothetical protein POSPLADRAFT_1047377 [Postia placenta MAD-698-R-SB12]OSX61111.1 hypothetical protein POSPLADRAFT_1047377 [Postia placenta MAD-698-R-SB12]
MPLTLAFVLHACLVALVDMLSMCQWCNGAPPTNLATLDWTWRLSSTDTTTNFNRLPVYRPMIKCRRKDWPPKFCPGRSRKPGYSSQTCVGDSGSAARRGPGAVSRHNFAGCNMKPKLSNYAVRVGGAANVMK